MIPNWALQILFVLAGLFAGAVWYYISKNSYQYALWSGYIVAILLLTSIALYIRNDIIKRDLTANLPTYFGHIIAADEPGPPLPSGVPPDTVQLLLGDDLRVLSASSENYILSLGDEPFLTIGVQDGTMTISTVVTDSQNHHIVRIIDNEFQAFPENAFNPKQPNEHTLVVRDSGGDEVFNIKFINSKTIRIVGRLHMEGYSDPVLILPDQGLRWPGGGGLGHLTVDMTEVKKGGLIKFPKP